MKVQSVWLQARNIELEYATTICQKVLHSAGFDQAEQLSSFIEI